MQHRNTLRGSLALVGVALVLIFTAGAAFADEGSPAATNDGAVTTSSQSTDNGGSDSQVGDALLIERPAPTRDPATELRDPADPPAVAAAPAAASTVAAPAPVSAPAPAAAPAAKATAAAAPAAAKPRVQVLGVQIVRNADGSATTLARTGMDTSVLVLVAGLLLAVGAVLIRLSQPLPSR